MEMRKSGENIIKQQLANKPLKYVSSHIWRKKET